MDVRPLAGPSSGDVGPSEAIGIRETAEEVRARLMLPGATAETCAEPTPDAEDPSLQSEGRRRLVAALGPGLQNLAWLGSWTFDTVLDGLTVSELVCFALGTFAPSPELAVLIEAALEGPTVPAASWGEPPEGGPIPDWKDVVPAAGARCPP